MRNEGGRDIRATSRQASRGGGDVHRHARREDSEREACWMRRVEGGRVGRIRQSVGRGEGGVSKRNTKE